MNQLDKSHYNKGWWFFRKYYRFSVGLSWVFPIIRKTIEKIAIQMHQLDKIRYRKSPVDDPSNISGRKDVHRQGKNIRIVVKPIRFWLCSKLNR